jgi:hypothetical protein
MAKYRYTSGDLERLKVDAGIMHIYSNGGFDTMTIYPVREELV